ncbi:MAG: hypothetical protein WBQ66_13060 [Blastocatellia bacterium]|jgi:limonene-1,2-epoxide hydrolase
MTATPIEMLEAYVRAFEALRTEDVVPFYVLPCTFIRPDGVWVVSDHETAVVLVNHLIEHALSQGYRRTAISKVAARSLAPTLTELTGIFDRFDAQDALIDRFGFTYVLREVSGQWKIAVAIAHDPPTQAVPVF